MAKETTEEKKIPARIKVKLYKHQEALEDMDDVSLLNVLDERFSAMRDSTIRQDQEKFWDEADSQFTAMSIRDEYGNLKINLPMEQNLIDTYEGRVSGKIIFDIQPDGKQADVDELQPAQYATEFYLEWGNNRGNGFYDEAPIIRRQKARYGTGFAFIGIDNKTTLSYKIKDGAEINGIDDLENKDNYEPYILDSYELFPKHLNIRSVFVDEKILGQTNIQEAEDIIIEKVMSLDKINFIRGNRKWYKDVDQLTESALSDQQKKNKDEFATNQVVIRFYYNSLSKDYVVYAPNDKIVIHKSKMIYNHNKLPIECLQHYSDETCLYGIGIPRKIKYIKGFKSEIMQAILDGAAKSTGLNFIIGNGWQVEDWNMWWDGVNVWRTSVWAENIKEVKAWIDAGLVSILNILDDVVVQDTGENVRATIDMQTDKVGIVEIMEENKAIRHKSVDENWNIFLDKSLTMMLSNIAQFVPNLLARTIEVEQWEEKVTKIEYPYIRIPNTVVSKKKGKRSFEKEDNYGKLWYFELKPWSLPLGLWVKIVTPSTHTSLPLVKRENISKWIDNKLTLTNIASLDQTGELMAKLKETINLWEINDWMNDVYGFEDKLKSQTGKDKIKAINMEKVEKLRAMMEAVWPTGQTSTQSLEPNTTTNGQAPQFPMTGQEETAPSFAQDQGLQDTGTGINAQETGFPAPDPNTGLS